MPFYTPIIFHRVGPSHIPNWQSTKVSKFPGYTVDRILLVSPILKHATCHQEFILHNLHDLETRLRTAFWWANDSDGLGVREREREREREGERERGRGRER